MHYRSDARRVLYGTMVHLIPYMTRKSSADMHGLSFWIKASSLDWVDWIERNVFHLTRSSSSSSSKFINRPTPERHMRHLTINDVSISL